MIESIVSILNARLETTGRIDKRYCLAEKRERSKDGASVPYSYEGKGELQPVDIGNPSLSWWRLTGQPSFNETPTTASVSKQTAIYPLRLVVMFRRKDSTKDDGFSPAWLAEDLSNNLTFSNGDLKTALKASDVRVNVTSMDAVTNSVWDDEFDNLQFTDPNYKTALIALELNVTVTALKSCWVNECDYDSDILHLFDFCKQGVVDRLTAAQVTCLTDALCGACDDATITINGVNVGTVASGGVWPQDIHDSAGADVGTAANPSVIADSTNQVNGVDIADPTVAEGTHNQQIHDSGGHNVGTAANPSVIGDATIQNDAIAPTWSDTVEAEGQYALAQGKALDSDGATTLLADYIPAANGFMFTCTPATGGPSVIVTTSDATPDYGDIVTITLTPTGMTPTAYVFYLPQCDGTYAKVTQGTNTYAWTVGTVGNVTVYGGCTDGTDTAYDVDGIAVNIPDGIGSISTPYGCCSVILQYPAYAGALVKIRRSSDNAEKDFYPDGSDELSLTSEDGAGTSLTTWIGANSGYVTTFYDQSGNARHGVQTTASAQPRIVNAGALETLNGKAAIYFDGVDDGMEWSAFGGLAYVDIYTVMGLPDNPYILFTDGSKYAYIAQSGSGTTSVENSWLSKPLLTNGVPRQWINRGEVYDAFAIATQIQFYAKGAVTSAWSNFRMLNHAGWYGEGYIQQMAVFNANSEAVTDIITASVNSNFNVY